MATRYRAFDITIEPEAVYDALVSGIARLRADQDEIRSIFTSLSVTRQDEIATWFTGDASTFNMGWGYVPEPEQSPSIHVVLASDVFKEKYIGNSAGDEVDEGDEEYGESRVSIFGKSINVIIRHNNAALSYYLFKIIKHIILVAEDGLTTDEFFDEFSLSTETGKISTTEGTWVYQYMVMISFRNEEKFNIIDDLETIVSVETDITSDNFEPLDGYDYTTT